MRNFSYRYDGLVIDNDYMINAIMEGKSLKVIMNNINKRRQNHLLATLKRNRSDEKVIHKDAFSFVKDNLNRLGINNGWQTINSSSQVILYHAHWKAEYKSVCFNTSGLNVTIHFDILKSPISFNIKETTNTNFCNFVLSLENYWKQWSIEDFHLEQFFEDNEQRWENKKKDVVKQIELYIDEQIRPQGYVTSIHVYNKVVVSIELRKGLRADFYLPFIDYEDGLRELTENIGKFKTLIENIPVPIKIVFNKDKTTE